MSLCRERIHWHIDQRVEEVIVRMGDGRERRKNEVQTDNSEEGGESG